MRKTLIILFFFITAIVNAQTEKPKLVVGIVVDQMRQDFIYRYWDTFGDDGFKRLVTEGFMLKNAHYNYVPTNTGPGHASIYTGTTPAYHGIISNSWYEKTSGEYVNCVGDSEVVTVGAEGDTGHASPHRMISSTITDELKLASQNRSKVISISLKDRGAILPAGHMADGAFWFDDVSGNFVSSSYYMEKLPRWVERFNKQKYPEQFAQETWNLLHEKKSYTASGPDESLFEVVLPTKTKAVFPYELKLLAETSDNFSFLRVTPYGNELVARMAIAALEGESLGTGAESDFLAISFSSTDHAGHAFGPNSVEIQDMYLRLDKTLGQLLNTLDEQIGNGKYTVFLTSDHGVVDVPARLDSLKAPGGYTRINIGKEVNDYLMGMMGKSVQFLKSVSNNQIFFDRSVLPGDDLNKATRLTVRFLQEREGIYEAYASENLSVTGRESNEQSDLLARGHNQKRSGDVVYTLQPGYSSSGSKQGTGHGTGFTYDTHIPILLYGHGIKQGASSEYHPISDLAPTLSVLLNIRFPSASTGQPITEAIK